jgi:hypothetical protein
MLIRNVDGGDQSHVAVAVAVNAQVDVNATIERCWAGEFPDAL